MNGLREYVRLALFSLGLLLGVQVPAVIDQYARTVQARQAEAELNFAEFRADAQRHFNGDIDALIAHYRASPDPIMRDGARSLVAIDGRLRGYRSEARALGGPWYRAAVHVALFHDPALLRDVLRDYSYTVPLKLNAIAWGLGCGLLLSATLADLILFLLLPRAARGAVRLARRRGRRATPEKGDQADGKRQPR